MLHRKLMFLFQNVKITSVRPNVLFLFSFPASFGPKSVYRRIFGFGEKTAEHSTHSETTVGSLMSVLIEFLPCL